MQNLHFPKFSFRFKNSENKTLIYDEIRKKFVVLQPEEWVRQHCVQFLIQVKGYPKSLINVEKELKVNNLRKRYDIVIYKPNGSIYLIVECKSAKIKIDQSTFDQIARYNLTLNAKYLMVTNGINHYYCEMDFNAECYTFLKELPNYKKSECF
ncbi:MAG: type I restriction enzyme HsdR N-terminal domain-containing protein [Oceanihabitans sp.]